MMKKRKVAVIVSGIMHRYVAFEWMVKYINPTVYELFFIAIDSKSETFTNFMQKKNIKTYHLNYNGTSRFSFFITMAKVYAILKREKVKVVHTHVFDANLIGLTAAFLAGIRTRIYTRHYSTGAYLLGPSRVKWDRMINKMATHIIAISEVVRKTLIEKEHVPIRKIVLIHHGLDLNEFCNIDKSRIDKLTDKYNPDKLYPVIGVISTFQKLKGIEYIINAFHQLLSKYPNAMLIMANAKGKDSPFYFSLLKEKVPARNFKTIVFEPDLFALFKLFDVFVHVPIDREIEAFGQVYIEAMASGVPMVVTKSGIANEILDDQENAFLVEYKSDTSLLDGLIKAFTLNDIVSQQIRKNYDLVKKFDIKNTIGKLEEVYSN